MPSPFPGMDPFLEDPAIFPDLHDRLIFCLSEALNGQLPEPYYASLGSRVWVQTAQRRIVPDVSLLHAQQTANGGMVAGGVVGGMIGQRIDQAQKHMYWRGQALEYREALAAGAPPLSQLAEGAKKEPWWSRAGREQRRLKRWERRAARRDGTRLGGE